MISNYLSKNEIIVKYVMLFNTENVVFVITTDQRVFNISIQYGSPLFKELKDELSIRVSRNRDVFHCCGD